MSEIYQIYEIEKHEHPDDKSELEIYLGTWERIGNTIREVRLDLHSYLIEDGEDVCKAIKKSGKYFYIFENQDERTKISLKAVKSKQRRGGYYPRIYLPVCTDDDLSGTIGLGKPEPRPTFYNNLPYDESHFIKSLEQLTTLIDSVNRIFRTIFPCPENLNTFGFDIRNVLILSCTEVETQFVGILKANKIRPRGKYPTTKDYVRLKEVLKVDEYEVKFNLFPDLPALSPFKGWSKDQPSESITWYANYNDVKHDRDNNFHKGRLVDLIEAISACYIMIVAQFGEKPVINQFTGNYMRITKRPKWKRDDMYIEPFDNGNWEEQFYKC